LKGELIENRIVIWNIQDSRSLFTNGYYGKPIGITKPKPDEITVPLILDLIEGLYLVQKSKIKVFKAKKLLTENNLFEICRNEYHTKILETRVTLSILELNLVVILQYIKKAQVLIMHHI
jgi:tRNA-intron endonuclease